MVITTIKFIDITNFFIFTESYSNKCYIEQKRHPPKACLSMVDICNYHNLFT